MGVPLSVNGIPACSVKSSVFVRLHSGAEVCGLHALLHLNRCLLSRVLQYQCDCICGKDDTWYKHLDEERDVLYGVLYGSLMVGFSSTLSGA